MLKSRLKLRNVETIVSRLTVKKVAVIVIALSVSLSALSQSKGDIGVGASGMVGVGGEYAHFGFGGKLLYNVTDFIRLAGEFDFFPEQDSFSWWDASAYGHYLSPLNDKFVPYLLVGLGMTGLEMNVDLGKWGKYNESVKGFVFTPGAGFDLKLMSNLIFNVEGRFKFINFKDIDVSGKRVYLTAGLVFIF